MERRKDRSRRRRENSPSGNPKPKSPAWLCWRLFYCNPAQTPHSNLVNRWARWDCNSRASFSCSGWRSEPSRMGLQREEQDVWLSRFDKQILHRLHQIEGMNSLGISNSFLPGDILGRIASSLKSKDEFIRIIAANNVVLLAPIFFTPALAQSPAAAPKSPAKPAPTAPAPAPAKPLVTSLPQSPMSDSSSNQDIIKILRKAKSFNTLIRLLKTTQIINQVNAQLVTTKSGGGLTILAPDDGTFSQLKAGYFNSLGDRQQKALIQFHVLPLCLKL
ncbi:hypothetical protein VNO78_03947 [Psophocarpus tetragonolobus]|uniref:FAS1 domain-containing protein n=1 Tax=Psophocarpus tetragonolobus TaxID=3891 RepID=A0AAN9T4Y7_PSOTE